MIVEWQGGSWTADDRYMLNFCFTYTGGAGASGARLPPPPLVVRF